VVEAAEEMDAPGIAGFNGGFLMHGARTRPERLSNYAGLSSALRQSVVPMSFILNETDCFSQIEEGIDLGFNAVMVEGDGLQPNEYLQLVKKVVRFAHARDVSVEAQSGRLPHGCERTNPAGKITKPSDAKSFVEATGVDALGVSIGNVHILTEGKAAIDLTILRRIRGVVDVPLVIHGGTGFPAECAAEAIQLGVAKFNFGTNLKQSYLTTLRDRLKDYAQPMNPHVFVGMGGKQDILVAAREAVKQKVKELIRSYGFARGRPIAQ
jgi:fructose/tagatose bisphosphate aldolase